MQMKRWAMTATYATSDHGNLDVDYAIDCLTDICTIIDQGPGDRSLVGIVIERDPGNRELRTIEAGLRPTFTQLEDLI